MSAAVVASLVAALVVLGFAYQQLLARTHLIEVALSRGLPGSIVNQRVAVGPHPTRHGSTSADVVTPEAARRHLADDVITVMVTASCTSCRRLVADLGDPALRSSHDLHVWFDREATVAADHWTDSIVGKVETNRHEIIDTLGVTVFPHAAFRTADGHVHAPVADLDALNRLIAGNGASVHDQHAEPGASA